MNIHDRPDALPLSKVRTNPPTKIGPISSESQREWSASETVRASMLPSGVVVVTVKREGATFGRAFHLASGGVEVELDCSGIEAREIRRPAGLNSGAALLEYSRETGAVAAVEEAHERVTLAVTDRTGEGGPGLEGFAALGVTLAPKEAAIFAGLSANDRAHALGVVERAHPDDRQGLAVALAGEAARFAIGHPGPSEPIAPGDKVDCNADPCASGHTPGELVPDSCARCGADLGKPSTDAGQQGATVTDGKGGNPPEATTGEASPKRRGRKPSGGPKA